MKLYVDFTPKAGSLVSGIRELADNDPAPGAPWELRTRDEFNAWVAAQEAAAPKRQETGIVRRRLTPAEKQALHAACASSWQIADFVALADSEGIIDESDPQFSDAVAALDSLGIIAADRWPALLAP